jgi:hypothetical protein
MNEGLKYTDRDVRENPDFYGAAVNYLVEYEGEFQFLIDCKMRVASGIDLTTGMVRGILNCMRVDPRVKNLPAPIEWPEDVIPIDRPSRTKPKRKHRVDCTRTDVHEHKYEDWQYLNYCPGIYLCSRETRYRREATVHSEFIFVKGKSPSTLTVHLVTKAEVEWTPFVHRWGWARNPEVIVHTACTYPHYLRNPILLRPQDVQDYNDQFKHELDEDKHLLRCRYCFSE